MSGHTTGATGGQAEAPGGMLCSTAEHKHPGSQLSPECAEPADQGTAAAGDRSLPSVNPRRTERLLHAEGVMLPPRRFTPNWFKASRKKELVGRYKTQRLIPKFKVSGQPVTLEVMSMTLSSGSGFWLIRPPKVVVEPKFKHYRNPLITPCGMISFFCKGQRKG